MKSLAVIDALIDASELVRAYRENGFGVEELKCCFQNASSLTEELTDVKSRLACTLKRLECSARTFSGPSEEAAGRHLVAMLRVNRTLQFVKLKVPYAIYDSISLRRGKEFHYQALPIARERLPLSCRLALLSVFASRYRSGHCERKAIQARPTPEIAANPPWRPVGTLDRHVASLIFDFAAECVRRRVYVGSL